MISMSALCCLLLIYSALLQTASSCPHVVDLFPPSGSANVPFVVRGYDIGDIESYQVTQNQISYGPIQGYPSIGSIITLRFLLQVTPRPVSGIVQILFFPKNLQNCTIQTAPLEFRPYDPYTSLILPGRGSVGTVVRIGTGSFPPTDGDNSTTFMVEIGGMVAPFILKTARLLIVQIRGNNMTSDVTNTTAPVEIVTSYGTRFNIGSWQYLPQGRIDTINPSRGQKGTNVLIKGSNLLGQYAVENGVTFTLHSVTLAGIRATILNYSNTEINLKANRGVHIQSSNDVKIFTKQSFMDRISISSYNGPTLSLNNSWVQLTEGVIEEVVPPYVQANQSVYICGRELLGGGEKISSVRFNSIASVNFSSIPYMFPWQPSKNHVCIEAVVPLLPFTCTRLSVLVIADTGAEVELGQNVSFGLSSVANVFPQSGQFGTEVNISGCALTGGSGDLKYVQIGNLSTEIIEFDYISSSWVVIAVGERSISNASTQLQLPIEITYSIYSQDFKIISDIYFTYLPNGEIDLVLPSHGQVGTHVVITGQSLFGHGGGLSNAFIGNLSSSIIASSDSMVTLIVPEDIPTGMTNVKLVSASGAVVRKDNVFKVLPPGEITDVQPRSGRWGTKVIISGSNLYAYSANITWVTIQGVPASIDYYKSTNNEVHVRVGPLLNNSYRGIVIETSNGVSIATSHLNWSYLDLGTIDSVSPNEGTNGTIVKIFGNGFLAEDGSLNSVFLNQVPAKILSFNDSMILVQNGDIGQLDVTKPLSVYIEAVSGALTIGGYFIQQETGQITHFSPIHGQEGVYVTVTGLNISSVYDPIVNASIANVKIIGITRINDSMVILRAGKGEVNVTGGITLLSQTGQVVFSKTLYNFTYDQPGEILSISPNVAVEGEVVRIQGHNLFSSESFINSISLAGSQVQKMIVISESEVLVIAGKQTSLLGQVVVTAGNGALIYGKDFQYIKNFTLKVLSDEVFGQFGTKLVINLPFLAKDAIHVLFGRNLGFVILRNESGYTMEVAAPRSSNFGVHSVDIVAEHRDGRVARLINGFQYTEEGVIHYVSPNYGQKGTLVIIYGRGLLGGGRWFDKVLLAGVPALVSDANDTVIVLRAGKSWREQNGDVVLVSNTGSTVKLTDGWHYLIPGLISGVVPLAGWHGTRVTISGMDLLSGGSEAVVVMVDGVPAASVETSSDKEVVIRIGNKNITSSVIDQIQIISETGGITSTSDPAFHFRYLESGFITRLTPTNGTGGTIVTIYGSMLKGTHEVEKVWLAGIPVIHIHNTSEEAIVVTAGFSSNRQTSSGNVTVELTDGSTIFNKDGWTYLPECPPGKFMNKSINTCQPCFHLCLFCDGPDVQDCFECKEDTFQDTYPNSTQKQCLEVCPYLSTLDHQCVDECEEFQYVDNFEGIAMCMNCSSMCHAQFGCTGSSEYECMKCAHVSHLGACIMQCPIGYYQKSDSTCQPCDVECDPIAGCSGPSATDCVVCQNLRINSAEGESCVNKCPVGHYEEGSYCLLCHEYCQQGCHGPKTSDCNECRYASVVYSNNSVQCLQDCNTVKNKSLFYKDLNGNCQLCHRMCSEEHGCTGGLASDCIRCSDDAFYLAADGTCLITCPSKYYNSSGHCLPCHSACEDGCRGPSSGDCIKVSTAPFLAGSGTIALVVIIIVALASLLLVSCIILIFHYHKQEKHYNLKKQARNVLGSVKNAFAGSTSLRRKESLKVSLSRRSSVLRRDAILGPGEPEFISPLIQGNPLDQVDDFTSVNLESIGYLGDSNSGQLSPSESGSDSNPYQEIPIVELHTQVDSDREDAERAKVDHEGAVQSEDEDYTLRVTFKSDNDDDETQETPSEPRYAAPSSTKAKDEDGSGMSAETGYYNIQKGQRGEATASPSSQPPSRGQYDSPRRFKRRTLSSSFIDLHKTRYDTPPQNRAVIPSSTHDQLLGFENDFCSTYINQSRPVRRKSLSGATLHHIHSSPIIPNPFTMETQFKDHIYATVAKQSQGNAKGTEEPASKISSGKKSTQYDTPTGFRRLLSGFGHSKVKGNEARPYEIPKSNSTSHPLPPIPKANQDLHSKALPLDVIDNLALPPLPVSSEDTQETSLTMQPTERIYEETFGNSESFSDLPKLDDTPPALPERRISKTTTQQPTGSQDVEIIWKPPFVPAESSDEESLNPGATFMPD